MVNRGIELKKSLTVLAARITAMAVDELNGHLAGRYPTYENLSRGLGDISTTLKRELILTKLLAFSVSEQEYFAPAEPLFRKEFEAKFISGAAELDEAAKCLALGRSTACVFHLMRLMECGLKATAACLGTPAPTSGGDRNWGNVLASVKGAIDEKSKTKTWANPTVDRDFFSEAYVSLDAVRVAWRNTTMHVEKTYTDDQAKHVLLAVKGFMTKLASRLDENGQPQA
jgi:hypothetical protein